MVEYFQLQHFTALAFAPLVSLEILTLRPLQIDICFMGLTDHEFPELQKLKKKLHQSFT